ncbi:MAG TPA: type II toxin-antitoxin system PemK/MazF family toxin [Jiangellales bacterium]|nr:type II toxin-antitoxin system PemK/MazF family toxin [Jiangellales bacterium]
MTGLRDSVLSLLRAAVRSRRPGRASAPAPAPGPGSADSPGRSGAWATTTATQVGRVRTSYAPAPDGDPDPGEIVWTWVPYEEGDGRGKDRPVLVVAREDGGTLLAVPLSSREHEGHGDWLPLGPGAWDSRGRPSWVALDRVLRVHAAGMRREGATLDRERFELVTDRLRRRYGWG